MTTTGWQRSSQCQEGSACVELRRHASSISGQAGNRLNPADAPNRTTLLRESDDPAVVIATTHTRLAGLIAAIKADCLA